VKVLITGGSSGIGQHLAATLLARGDEVVIVADGAARLEAAAAELRRIAPRVEALACDVGDAGAVARMVDAVLERGCPDVLVNNAGFAVYRTFEQSPPEEIERLLQVNLLGALRCTRGFLPAMIARGSGHVVNVASVAGLLPITPCAAYGAAKHGLVGISETLRWELHDLGIKVHLVCPGRVQTAFFDDESFRTRAHRPETEKTIPIDEVSRAILRAVERDRFLTVLPRSLALAVWARRVAPWLVDPLLGRILRTRVREVRARAAGRPATPQENAE
jgi:short-subunit dehydrogenase